MGKINMDPEQKDALLEIGEKQKRKGVVYLSRIPPNMHVEGLRKMLTKRFEIGRIYLQAEHENITRKRKKMGGGRKVRYIEGWIEFIKKHDGKMCAMALNGQLIGGKKRHNMHRDDTWNMKYLSKFAWSNLTEKLVYDQKMREQRLKQVKSQTTKEISFFQEKQDLSRKLSKIEERKVADLARHQAMESEEEDEVSEVEEADEKSGDEDSDEDGLAAITKNVKNKRKRAKNLEKILKYNQRKRREFTQRTPIDVDEGV